MSDIKFNQGYQIEWYLLSMEQCPIPELNKVLLCVYLCMYLKEQKVKGLLQVFSEYKSFYGKMAYYIVFPNTDPHSDVKNAVNNFLNHLKKVDLSNHDIFNFLKKEILENHCTGITHLSVVQEIYRMANDLVKENIYKKAESTLKKTDTSNKIKF